MRFAVSILFLLSVLITLQYQLRFVATPESQRLQQHITQQLHKNQELQARNDALIAEVMDLKTGQAAVEERARLELGLIKPGETFYQLLE